MLNYWKKKMFWRGDIMRCWQIGFFFFFFSIDREKGEIEGTYSHGQGLNPHTHSTHWPGYNIASQATVGTAFLILRSLVVVHSRSSILPVPITTVAEVVTCQRLLQLPMLMDQVHNCHFLLFRQLWASYLAKLLGQRQTMDQNSYMF